MLTTVPYRWDIHPRAPKTHFEQFPDIPPLVVQILYNREIFEPQDVYSFLNGGYAINDPFLLPDMEAAVTEILTAIEAQTPMVVYGDYDADGVTSTALLMQALQTLGANVSAYIPNRFTEGYGLNKKTISKLAGTGAKLIVTVDCGIRSVAEVAHGNQLGLRFVITDHHLLGVDDSGAEILPPAVAVVNPKRRDSRYPFRDFAGVGVAFKLAQALNRRAPQNGQPPLDETELLDLVALGTVADLVPLTRENRTLVQRGLAKMQNPVRPGVRALMEIAGATGKTITAETIGFVLGPRLNAAGRLKEGMLAYQLLATDDPVEAQKLAMELNQINSERQFLTREFTDKSLAQFGDDETLDALYLVTDEAFNSGVVGLVASRLTEMCYRPILVAHRGETHTRGSARSIPEFDITRALDQCADLLVKYGGHAAAAGFTVENEKLEAFRERLTAIARQSFDVTRLRKSLPVDAEINLRGVRYDLVAAIEKIAPFGHGNPTPVFVSRNLEVRHHTLVGKEKTHLKMRLFDGKQMWDAIGFGLGKQWQAQQTIPGVVDAVFSLEINRWGGREQLQLKLKDIRPAEQSDWPSS